MRTNWIDVESELPDSNGEYWVFFKNLKVHKARYVDGEWMSIDNPLTDINELILRWADHKIGD